MTRTLLLFIWLALVCALATAGEASAQSTAVSINGSPLQILTDGSGGTQVRVDGGTAGEFFNPSSDVGNAGFGLIVDPQGQNGGPFFLGRFIGSLPTPDSGPTVTPGNPATITTTWTITEDPASGPLLKLTQVLSYVNGQRQFDAHYTVQNVSAQSINFRANVAGDLAIRGSDQGIGFFSPGPPRFVGGINQDVGAAGGFVEETPPWTSWQSDTLGNVGSAAGDATGPGFNDFISGPPAVDNAAGVQWDDFYPGHGSLAPQQSVTFNVGWRFVDTLGILPPVSNDQTGNEHVLTGLVGDLNGNGQTGQSVVWNVTGANSASGKTVSGTGGLTSFSYVGGNPGQDTVTAFVDQNNNGIRDASEPQATALVNWTGPPPPLAGSSVGVRTEAGSVKFQPPKNTSPAVAKRLGIAPASLGKFLPLSAAQDIPVGSQIDTSRGRVRLLASGAPGTNTWLGGSFNGGKFLVGQGHSGGLTQLSMVGGNLNSCGTKTPKGGAARKKRGRSLFANVHGSFRTRGRNSSATVRGTIYLVKDSCKGTLTQVTRGSVVVRDFSLRKNKVVTAGHKYLAKPPKKKKRH